MAESFAGPRTRFEFEVEGTPLVGWRYAPPAGVERVAQAVLTGPLTSVKEQSTGNYADALARRGIVALAFDHRTFGESGGDPRQFENPLAKIEDIQAAGAALRESEPKSLPMLGVGICAGGGYMAGAVSGGGGFDGFVAIAGYFSRAAADAASSPAAARGRAAEERWRSNGETETIPAVGEDGGDVAMPLREAYEYYGTARGALGGYINAFAVQSMAYTSVFDSQEAAASIRVPALIVHSRNALAPDLARTFADQLSVERQEIWLESPGQIDFYDDRRLIYLTCDAVRAFVKVFYPAAMSRHTT